MVFTKSATVVTLPSNRYQNPYPSFEKAQDVIESESGSITVYDRGVEVILAQVVIRVSNATRSSLRSFIRTTINYQAETFTLTPDTGIDLGNGAGVDIGARYIQATYVEKPLAYGKWEVSFSLRLTPSGGP